MNSSRFTLITNERLDSRSPDVTAALRETWGQRAADHQWMWLTHKPTSADARKQRVVSVTGNYFQLWINPQAFSHHPGPFLDCLQMHKKKRGTWFIKSGGLNHDQATSSGWCNQQQLLRNNTKTKNTHKNMLPPFKTIEKNVRQNSHMFSCCLLLEFV